MSMVEHTCIFTMESIGCQLEFQKYSQNTSRKVGFFLCFLFVYISQAVSGGLDVNVKFSHLYAFYDI